MPGLIKNVVRAYKRQARESRKAHRTKRLVDVGCQLLNGQDHEALSVVKIAKEANVSVGAFYARFASKDEFLFRVVAQSLGRAVERAQADLDPGSWERASSERIVRAIVENIIHTLNSSSLGAVRVAWKCGQLEPSYLRPLLAYRTAVADQAVALLQPRLKTKTAELQIRAAVQILLATTIDALFQDEGPLHAGRQRLAETLGRTMALLIGLEGDGAEVGGEDAVIVADPVSSVAATISGLVQNDGPDVSEVAEAPPPKAATKARTVKPLPTPPPKRRIRFL